jgi:hypothetical protein
MARAYIETDIENVAAGKGSLRNPSFDSLVLLWYKVNDGGGKHPSLRGKTYRSVLWNR